MLVLASQASSVQALLSLQVMGVPPMQTPALQPPPLLHWLPSSQLPPSLLGVLLQPVVGLQLSSVQRLWSSQGAGLPVQLPALQVSPVVHWLPSSQG